VLVTELYFILKNKKHITRNKQTQPVLKARGITVLLTPMKSKPALKDEELPEGSPNKLQVKSALVPTLVTASSTERLNLLRSKPRSGHVLSDSQK
jgi:hypothetical protein